MFSGYLFQGKRADSHTLIDALCYRASRRQVRMLCCQCGKMTQSSPELTASFSHTHTHTLFVIVVYRSIKSRYIKESSFQRDVQLFCCLSPSEAVIMLLELPRRLLSSSSRLYGRARGQCVLLCTPGFIFLCKRYVSSCLHLLHMLVCACVVLLSRLPADAAGCESSRTEGRPLRWSQSGKNSIFSRVFEARG